MGKLNGPRFTSFLKRITEELPVEFEEVYAPGLGYLATPYGIMTVEEFERKNPDIAAKWEQEKAARDKESDE